MISRHHDNDDAVLFAKGLKSLPRIAERKHQFSGGEIASEPEI